jgi:hypothetical protein
VKSGKAQIVVKFHKFTMGYNYNLIETVDTGKHDWYDEIQPKPSQ